MGEIPGFAERVQRHVVDLESLADIYPDTPNFGPNAAIARFYGDVAYLLTAYADSQQALAKHHSVTLRMKAGNPMTCAICGLEPHPTDAR